MCTHFEHGTGERQRGNLHEKIAPLSFTTIGEQITQSE